MIPYGTPVHERWPWVDDGNPNTQATRLHRWSMREVLYSEDERAAISQKFPQLTDMTEYTSVVIGGVACPEPITGKSMAKD